MYDATSGTLTFPVETTQQTISVVVHGDNKHEHNETFGVLLSNPVGATITTAQANMTITNDDDLPTISIASTSVNEGNDPNNPNHLLFTVTLSGTSSDTITATASSA